MFSLADLLRLTNGRMVGPPLPANMTFCGAQTDSRQVIPGQLFVAYPGDRLDGHDYAAEAVARGAALLMVSRQLASTAPQLIVDDPRAMLGVAAGGLLREAKLAHVIGITGSAGKTTTRMLVAGLFEAAFPSAVLASDGSLNTDTGLSMAILGGLRPGVRHAVFEMGCQNFGEIAHLCGIVRPNAAVVTSIGGAHLAYLGSLEGVARAKGELVEALPAAGRAILNADDDRVRQLSRLTAAETVTFGLAADADCRAEGIEERGLAGQHVRWCCGAASGTATTPLVGVHNARNVLAAIAVARWAGVPAATIDATLPALRPPPGRLHPIAGPAGSWLLDDTYNASRQAGEAALAILRSWRGRTIALLGDMFELGASSAQEHRLLGRAATSLDLLGVVGHDAMLTGESAIAHGLPPDRLVRFPCDPRDAAALAHARAAAAAWLRETVRDGDLALVKASRGMGLDAVIREAVAQHRQEESR